MKRKFTLLAAMLLSVTLFAQRGQSANSTQSKLSISFTSNSNVRVTIDGRNYKPNKSNTVLVNNLSSGYHAVKVYQLKRNGRNNNGNQNGNSNGNMNGYQLVYSGNINVKPRYHVDILINRFGKALVDEQLIRSGYYDDDGEDWSDNWNNDNYNQVMNATSFEQFKQTLKNSGFDNTRLITARQVISTNYFTSAQVREVLDQFSFENNKLEIAKFAYKYTVDKGNYFTVSNAFAYSSSKDELMRYIQTQ